MNPVTLLSKTIESVDQYLVDDSLTIRGAIEKMDEAGIGLAVYVDHEMRVVGVISDGDFRRAVLSGKSLDEPVSVIVNRDFVSVEEGCSPRDVDELFKSTTAARHIPVLSKGRLVDILMRDALLPVKAENSQQLSGSSVVIMAGGKGTRLDPFTRILPKPLIPIGERPVISLIIEKFVNAGVDRIVISVNEKAQMIKAYFQEDAEHYQIEFLEEKMALGTAGALAMLRGEFDKPFFVSNCDILVKTDYSEVANFHLKGKYSITIVGSMIHHTVPYGVCEINKDGELIGISEKPEYDYLINTGFYMMNPEVLDLIPDDSHTDMTSVIEMLKNNKQKVGVFPISKDSWYDVGEWSQYAHTLEKY